MLQKVLDIQGLCVDAVDRHGKRTPIVQNIDVAVEAGKVVALIGESGSGKSTISLASMGYARPGCRISGGRVVLDGIEVLDLSRRERRSLRGVDVAYIAQSAAAAFNGALTIGRQVIEVPVIKKIMSRSEAESRAAELYRLLNLPNPDTIGRLYPHQVSGGQLQRLMAAMAMLCNPKLLILDEPTTALDVTTQIEVLEAFRTLIRKKGTAAIYVSHDLAVVAQMADKVLVLKDGRMVEYEEIEKIISQPKADYTKQLMSSVKVLPSSVARRDRGTSDATPLLEVEHVTAGYGKGRDAIALKDVSFAVLRGETVGIIGESGSGKSTTARVLAGLMDPFEGRVVLNDQPLAGRIERRTNNQARQIQLAFQMADTALNPRQKLLEILGRPLRVFQDMERDAIRERVVELLDLVELPRSFLSRYPHQLSGGQKQRVNLARALAAEPDLIICDEITSALDTVVAAAIMELLKQLRDRLHVTYVFISHDLSTVANFADRIVVMRSGEVVDSGPTPDVLSPPHPDYTKLLLDSVPQLRTDWLDEVMGRH